MKDLPTPDELRRWQDEYCNDTSGVGLGPEAILRVFESLPVLADALEQRKRLLAEADAIDGALGHLSVTGERVEYVEAKLRKLTEERDQARRERDEAVESFAAKLLEAINKDDAIRSLEKETAQLRWDVRAAWEEGVTSARMHKVCRWDHSRAHVNLEALASQEGYNER